MIRINESIPDNSGSRRYENPQIVHIREEMKKISDPDEITKHVQMHLESNQGAKWTDAFDKQLKKVVGAILVATETIPEDIHQRFDDILDSDDFQEIVKNMKEVKESGNDIVDEQVKLSMIRNLAKAASTIGDILA